MLIPNVVLTKALSYWLSTRRDPDTLDLVVSQCDSGIIVLRADGDEPSANEATHIRAVMAANAVEPLALPARLSNRFD